MLSLNICGKKTPTKIKSIKRKKEGLQGFMFKQPGNHLCAREPTVVNFLGSMFPLICKTASSKIPNTAMWLPITPLQPHKCFFSGPEVQFSPNPPGALGLSFLSLPPDFPTHPHTSH